MPFALVFLGLVMVVSGAKDTYKELGAEVVADFTGPANFTWWVMAIGAVGAVGYYAPARNFSRMFLVLIIVSMVLAQQRGAGGGFFGQLDAALKAGPESPSTSNDQASGVPTGKPIVPVTLNVPVSSTNADAQENFGKVMQAVKFFVSGMP
jgi:hypothetical protein